MWHTARDLFAIGTPGDESVEELRWDPGEEEIESWVESSGAEFLGYRESDLVNSGTPSFRVSGPLVQNLGGFPMHHIDCGGASVHIVADDGEAIVWIEDWLGGCLPRGFADEGFGYGDQIVAEHIDKAVDKKVSEISRTLGGEWRLQSADSDSDSDKPASRAVWIKAA